MTFKTSPEGIVSEYDEYGRKTFSVRPDGFHYGFSYDGIDPNGLPTREYDSDGVVREYTVDDGIDGFTIDEYPLDRAIGKWFEPLHRIIA